MAENDRQGIHLGFFSKTQKADPAPLALIGVDGCEQVSDLFAFDLLLYRRADPLEEEQLAALVADPCVIALGVKKTDLFHGVLASIEHMGGAKGRGTFYKAHFVSHLHLLAMGRRSAIYQETTVPEMIEAILGSYGLVKDKTFSFHVSQEKKSPKHEYIVQYNESDWHFIERWLEKEGFFYWLRHTAEGVSLHIADSIADASQLDEPKCIPYRERNNLALGDDKESLWAFHARHKRVASSVTLVDYNDQRPMDLLVSTQEVDKGGFGQWYEYGLHFGDKALGGEWARVRSEELYAERRVFNAITDCARVRVGHVFELENHDFAAYDGAYLITRVEHRAGIDTRVPREDFDDLGAPRSYRAKLTAVAAGVPFRPQRRTSWPRIEGVISAHVEADTAGDFAQIDDQGRYKVKFPFDLGTKKGLPSSRWIRMAQSYAGTGYGQHMPQHKGTEVLIAHVDGDPDRPLIVGAVPNPVTPSPVVSKNATQSVLQTASGIRVELEDRA